MSAEQFDIIATGLCYATVCTTLDDEAAGRLLNLARPTGIPSQWEPSADPLFADGVNPNPCVCERDSARHHRLFSC